MTSSLSKKILIVEDEADVVDLLTLQLRKAGGFLVSVARDGAEALKKARAELPALVVLDLMLPRMPGLEVCKILKTESATRHIPIIMLTAKAEEVDRIVGLEFGADDYVTKPFSPREMLLRIKAILRRGQNDGIGRKHDPRHDHDRPGAASCFCQREADQSHRGRVQTPEHADAAARPGAGARSFAQRSLGLRERDRHAHGRTHVRRLREKLGKAASAVETVRGFGYRLRE